MAVKKNQRESKAQLGQFMTPPKLVGEVLVENAISFTAKDTVLEPSLGTGHFVFDILDRFIEVRRSVAPDLTQRQALALTLKENLWGVEYDAEVYQTFQQAFAKRYGSELAEFKHHFERDDFFRWKAGRTFTYVIGNPPFGGTFDPLLEDKLDRRYGLRNGEKIKKETYAFFIIKCLDLLAEGGVLVFILSDTFLTINTMRGLRRYLTHTGEVTVEALSYFSDETSYGMVVLRVNKGLNTDHIKVNGKKVQLELIESTPNYSFGIQPKMAFFFQGSTLGKYLLASSGMTVGKNELFLRPVGAEHELREHLAFTFEQQPITLANELSRARLHRLSDAKVQQVKAQEAAGETRRNLVTSALPQAQVVQLPSPDYRYYNKAVRGQFYAPPSWAIFWKDDGDAVYTFKKNGPWYLHGVGGKSFFNREGITWNLISSTIQARFLPAGYILDSGAPLAVLRPGVAHDELWFILGWLNTDLATKILKEVINHTKNIQSKDMERMPYPHWVGPEGKRKVVQRVEQLIRELQGGKQAGLDAAKVELEALFQPPS